MAQCLKRVVGVIADSFWRLGNSVRQPRVDISMQRKELHSLFRMEMLAMLILENSELHSCFISLGAGWLPSILGKSCAREKYRSRDANSASACIKRGFGGIECISMRCFDHYFLNGVGAELDFQGAFSSFDVMWASITKASYIFEKL